MAFSKKSRLLVTAVALVIFGAGLWLFLQSPASNAAKPHHSAMRSKAVAESAQAPEPSISAVSTPVSAQFVSSAPALGPSTAPTSTAVTQPSVPVPQAPLVTAASPASKTVVVPQTAEVRATRAMYMAHAPVRKPDIADPDSEANRKILQTMVEKALFNREATR